MSLATDVDLRADIVFDRRETVMPCAFAARLLAVDAPIRIDGAGRGHGLIVDLATTSAVAEGDVSVWTVH